MLRILAVLTLLLISCSGGASGPSGGITGTVTLGPMCPVVMQGSPCPDAPWTGTVRAVSASGQVSETQTVDQGRYRLSLSDGTYEVTPVIEGGGPPSAAPVSVTVTGGAMQTLDLQVDSGIR
jgi:hypothetical protein